MSRNAMQPTHPGEILREELDALNMSVKVFASALDVPGNRIGAILKGQRLSRYLGTTPEFWLNLQKSFELRVAELEAGKEIAKHIKPIARPRSPSARS